MLCCPLQVLCDAAVLGPWARDEAKFPQPGAGGGGDPVLPGGRALHRPPGHLRQPGPATALPRAHHHQLHGHPLRRPLFHMTPAQPRPAQAVWGSDGQDRAWRPGNHRDGLIASKRLLIVMPRPVAAGDGGKGMRSSVDGQRDKDKWELFNGPYRSMFTINAST